MIVDKVVLFLAIVGMISSLASLFNTVSDEALWRVIVRGPLAGRENYTALGWKLHTAALACFIVASGVILLGAFLE